MMAVIGVIAVTLILGYIALWFFSMAMFPLLGFDELNIPVGLLLLVPGVGTVALWWWLVGSNISLGFNYN